MAAYQPQQPPRPMQPSLDNQYKDAKKMTIMIQSQLVQLETGRNVSMELQGEVSSNINALTRTAQSLEPLVYQEPMEKREIWRRKIQQLIDESVNLSHSLDRFLATAHRKEKEQEEREALFRRAREGPTPAVGIDSFRGEHDSLRRSGQMVDDLTGIGAGVLSGLAEQRERLKGAHKKILDIAHTLGLSNSLLRVIERREYVDRLILFGGMLGILAVIFLIYWFVL